MRKLIYMKTTIDHFNGKNRPLEMDQKVVDIEDKGEYYTVVDKVPEINNETKKEIDE